MANQGQTTGSQDLEGSDAWTRHQHLISNYVKHYHKPDKTSHQDNNYKSERDILVENHLFLRSEEDDQDLSWEKRVAKKYYDKLFKEFALVDLKYYKESRIAMRWRNENEVFRGKGQFTCANLRCNESSGLQSWEVNFGYVEQGEKKNALVKVRLCEKDSYKLNYKTQQRQASSDHDITALSESRPSTQKRNSLTQEEEAGVNNKTEVNKKKRRRHDSGDHGRERSSSAEKSHKSSRRDKHKGHKEHKEHKGHREAESSRRNHRGSDSRRDRRDRRRRSRSRESHKEDGSDSDGSRGEQ